MPSMTAKVVDVNAGEWDKGDSVRLIANYLGISLEEVVVFGDSENDLPMIETVPNSVAVANADSDVSSAARWHIASAKDDAVATAMLDMTMRSQRLCWTLLGHQKKVWDLPSFSSWCTKPYAYCC